MSIKFKRIGLHTLPLPTVASPGAAGMDLRAVRSVTLWPGQEQKIGTGFAMEVPAGMGAFLLPRSGLGSDYGIVLGNLVGMIDSDYRGQLMVSLWNRRTEGEPVTIEAGERIAQMVIAPVLLSVSEEVSELSETSRGEGGFGSTGKE